MSPIYTYSIEQYKGVKVLCIESKQYLGYSAVKGVISELEEIMFLPRRILYKGGSDTWNGLDYETDHHLYIGGTYNKEAAVKSIIIENS